MSEIELSEHFDRMNRVVEELLKGKETRLEDGISFKDKDGTERFDCRVKWWQPNTKRKIMTPNSIVDIGISVERPKNDRPSNEITIGKV